MGIYCIWYRGRDWAIGERRWRRNHRVIQKVARGPAHWVIPTGYQRTRQSVSSDDASGVSAGRTGRDAPCLQHPTVGVGTGHDEPSLFARMAHVRVRDNFIMPDMIYVMYNNGLNVSTEGAVTLCSVSPSMTLHCMEQEGSHAHSAQARNIAHCMYAQCIILHRY